MKSCIKYLFKCCKKNLFILLFIYITSLSLVLMKNTLDHNIAIGHEDEIHTINFGINSIDGEYKGDLRVGETSRWLARLIYPYAIYYMNTKMGGEHYITGWRYPGGFYIKNNHNNTDISKDPNRQDFVYAMRYALNLILILSFSIVSLVLYSQYGPVSGVAYQALSLGSAVVINNYSIFYHESVVIIAFNALAAAVLISDKNSYRAIFWFALICSFAFFSKLTGAVLLFPAIVVMLARLPSFRDKPVYEFFVLCLLVVSWLINIKTQSVREIIDQYLSNIYHLKTGHLYSYPPGLYQLKLILSWIWPTMVASILAVFLVIKTPLLKNKEFIVSTLFAGFLIIFSMIDVRFFMCK